MNCPDCEAMLGEEHEMRVFDVVVVFVDDEEPRRVYACPNCKGELDSEEMDDNDMAYEGEVNELI